MTYKLKCTDAARSNLVDNLAEEIDKAKCKDFISTCEEYKKTHKGIFQKECCEECKKRKQNMDKKCKISNLISNIFKTLKNAVIISVFLRIV